MNWIHAKQLITSEIFKETNLYQRITNEFNIIYQIDVIESLGSTIKISKNPLTSITNDSKYYSNN